MEEIEVKIIEINKEEIIKKLLELGAKKRFEGEIKALSYDLENNSLRDKKSFLRLRKVGDKSFLTFKQKISQDTAKVMEEIETEISDFDEMHKILLLMGLKHYPDSIKKRTSFKIGDVLFEIDEYAQIPAYMEIEAPALEQVNEFVEKLGIGKSKVKNWTGKELFDHYGIKSSFMRI